MSGQGYTPFPTYSQYAVSPTVPAYPSHHGWNVQPPASQPTGQTQVPSWQTPVQTQSSGYSGKGSTSLRGKSSQKSSPYSRPNSFSDSKVVVHPSRPGAFAATPGSGKPSSKTVTSPTANYNLSHPDPSFSSSAAAVEEEAGPQDFPFPDKVATHSNVGKVLENMASSNKPLSNKTAPKVPVEMAKAAVDTGLVPVQSAKGCKTISPEVLRKGKPKHKSFRITCNFIQHYRTTGCHRALSTLNVSYERVAIRRLLDYRISLNSFYSELVKADPQMACYTVETILLAAFNCDRYRTRWLHLEQDSRGTRYVQYRQLTEEAKQRFRKMLTLTTGQKGLQKKIEMNTDMRNLSVFDCLISVFGDEFYTLSSIHQQSAPISDLVPRLLERFRYRELGRGSPAKESLNTTDHRLTSDQKLTVVGLLHRGIQEELIIQELAYLYFESFSKYSTLDVLAITLGHDYKEMLREVHVDANREPVEDGSGTRLIGIKKAYWNPDTNTRDIFPNTEPKPKKKKKRRLNEAQRAKYKQFLANSKYKQYEKKLGNSLSGPSMQAILSSNFENGAKLSDLGLDTCTSTHALMTEDIDNGMKVGGSVLGSSDSAEQ